MSQGPGPRPPGLSCGRRARGSLRHSAGAPASPTPTVQRSTAVRGASLRGACSTPHQTFTSTKATRHLVGTEPVRDPLGRTDPASGPGPTSASILSPGLATASHTAWAPDLISPNLTPVSRKWRVAGGGGSEGRWSGWGLDSQGARPFPEATGALGSAGGGWGWGAFLRLEKDPGGGRVGENVS